MSKESPSPETTKEVVAIATRQWQLRQGIEEAKRNIRDHAASQREHIRRLEQQLKEADEQWASPVIQGELF